MMKRLCASLVLFIASVLQAQEVPVLRGAMISPNASAEDLRALRALGANCVRWQLNWDSPRDQQGPETPAQYRQRLETVLKRMDEMLPLCEELGLSVVPDLHQSPGGRDKQNNCLLFQEESLQDQFVAIWKDLARRYKARKPIVAMDLLNEAVEGIHGKNCLNWRSLAIKAGHAIREIDPSRTLVFEPSPWADANGFANLEPLPLENVIYSFHYYTPHSYTHQGVDSPKGPITYPGTINGVRWDKDRIRKEIEPVVQFQQKYHVPIYVGEFSAVRWAPGANQYLSDVLELWEEHHWSWTYHAFREWSGWSFEHTADENDTRPSPTPTERQRLLERYFRLNGAANPTTRPAVTGPG